MMSFSLGLLTVLSGGAVSPAQAAQADSHPQSAEGTAVPDLETHVFHSDIEVTEQYEELISVSSLLARFHGLRFQAEYAWLPNVRVTPYVFANFFEDADFTPLNSFKSVLAGVNLGLAASLVLKLEGGILRLHQAVAANDVEISRTQLATSF